MKSKHPLFSLCLKHLLLGLFVFCSLGHVHAQNGPDCANSLCFGPGTSYSANSDLTITANQYYSYMQIKTNRTLTVKAGFTLYVGPVGTGAETEVFDLQNNGIIIVESGATLVIYGKLNNSNNSTTFTVDGTLIVYGNIYSGNGTQIVGTGSVSATGTITGGGSVLGTPATCSTGPCNSCTPLANSISSSQSYCTATTPTVFTGTDIPSATYQWAKSTTSATIGFANISGATSKDYTSASVSATTYFIRYATVGTCVYVSNVATVSIGSTALSITTPPATSSACDGSAESFSVVASGASLTYKWQQDPNTGFFADITDGGVFSGSTTTSLSISNVSGLNNYKYRVIVASACGTPASATSSSATLTVNANPTSAVLANGTGSNFKCYGSTMNLKATVTGGLANFKVKYTDGLTIDSVTNYVSGNDFVITPVQSGSYSLMSVTDANGCLSISNSSTATVTVTTTTTISASSDGSRCGAGTVNLSATPSAGIVRWYNTPTGGTSIGSGSPFTTPSISTTTSYYAEAFNNPCVSVTRRKVTAFIGTSLLPAMSGTGTYTIPAGVTTMSVQCWGGGGGGGGARETGSGTARGGGGAGGAYASVTSLAVSAGEIYDFSVGAVGTAGNGNGNGSNGGDSYFVLSGVDKVRAKGGTFGFGTLNGNGNGGTAALVSASVGTLKNAGGNGATATNSGSGGGGGAAGVAGTGGAGAVTLGGASQSGGSDKGGNGLTAHTTTGNSGVGVGAGGGGAFASAGGSNSTTAGAGQAGQIILTISAPTISYTGSPYCKSVTSALVTIVGIQGWQFIAPVGLTIDAATGEINPSTSTAGTYQIIYRDPCGAADVTTNVTITDLPVVTSSSSICIGSTTSILTPTTGGTWTSSNTGFATVTNAGVVTGVAAGSPTFTFLNTTTNCSSTTSSVTVNALPVVSVTGSSSICVGGTTSLAPTTGGTWTSSNTGFATVTNAGVVTGVAAGSPTFTFLNTTTGCSKTTSAVTVNALPVVTSASSICIGSTTSILTPTTGGTWTSSNTGFATVTNAGVVTGVAAGSPTFTFLNTTTNCSNTTSAVTVNALPVVTSGSSICVGSTTSILTPTTGGTWTSSNTGFATVTNAGVVTGVAAGSPTFTFLNTTTGCSKTTSAVTVNALPVVTSASSICIGSTTSILTPTTGGTWTSSNTGFATVTNAGVVTGVAAGSPTFTFLNTTTNCSNTTSAVTVNALPVVSVTGSSSICVGGTSSLSPTTGGTWTSSNTGFATVTNTGVVTAVAAGSPTFTFLNTTTGCSKTTSAITINTNPTTATIAGSATICSGNTTNLTVTMTGGSGLYTVNYSGGTLTNYASGTNIVVSPTVNTTYTLSSVTDANGCAAQSLINNAIVTLDAPGKWVGSTSDWHTASNWCGNAVPSITTDVTINSGSTAIISSGDAAVNSITIGSGMSVQVNNSRKLFVYGNWINAGVFTSGTSTVEFAKSGIQTISNTNSGTESFYNLSLNGSGTKTISSGTNVNILPSGALIFASGISLDVNNQILTLKSGVSVSPDYIDNTARLVAMPSGAGFVNASNFKVERYIPSGKRTVRFLSSPVSGATVADWNNSFYITGSKASYPDNITLNSTISTITDYTESLNGLSSQKFTEVYGLGTVLLPGKGYRAFIRGGKDIDLSNPLVAPVATATTLSVKGLPNVGDITRNLTYTNHSKLSDDGWNLVGNPYPSQIDWDLISVSERVNVPNSFSIFDPRLGTNGAYYTYAGGGVGTPARSNPSIIPSSQSFFVKLSSAGAGSITFKEFQKSTLSHRGNFRIAHDNLLRISISDTGTFDETVVQLLEGSSEAFDSEYDAQKLSNAGINIFTVSSKGDNLAINRTPLTSSMNIRLGVSNRYKGTHTFKFSNDPSFADAKLYLEDKYLRKVTQVVDGGEYFFDITSDVNSSGIDRFVLTNQPTVVTSTDNSFLSGKVALKVYPNPTDGKQIHLDLYASMKGNVKLKITDLSGKVVYTRDLGSANDLSFTHYVINDLKDLANGVYVVNCEGETSNFKSIFTIAK